MSKLKRKFGKRLKYNYKRTFFVLFLFLLLGGFGLVYSYLTTNLSIDGTSNVKGARWDVHFANVQVSSGSVEAETPVISNQTTVNFSATLANPGDFYEFTIDLVNSGTLNAKIDEINITPVLTAEQQEYFSYTVTYADGVPVQPNDALNAGVTEKIKVQFRYLYRSDSTLYPEDDANFNFRFIADCIQKDETSNDVNHPQTVYTANVYFGGSTPDKRVYIGQPIPEAVNQYDTPEEAVAALQTEIGDSEFPLFLQHTVQDGIVTESYLGFIVTPEMALANPGMTAGTYALRGAVCDTPEPPEFHANKSTVLTAFGSDRCVFSDTTHASDDIQCTAPNLRIPSGYCYVWAISNSWMCSVYYQGDSYCTVYD